MRRQYQQVDDPAVLGEWLNEALVGRLATVDQDGYPVIKPVNYVFTGGKIYFHSAKEGEKLDDIRRESRVGFEVDRIFAITPPPERGCQTHCFYQSVIVRGRARILDDPADLAAKEEALHLLVKKYHPPLAGSPLSDVEKTVVVEISIDHLTGKEDFGQKWSPARKLTVAKLLYQRDGEAAAENIARLGVSMPDAKSRGEDE